MTAGAPGSPATAGDGSLWVLAPDGTPEVAEGDDLVALLLDALARAGAEVVDGDVLVVTSKVVSKAEGRVVAGTDRDAVLAGETARVVARRGPTTIVRTHHGLTMAAAGIDASNVAPGTLVLLPLDPDASARRLRDVLVERTGRTVAVVVTDTAGRAWREGQTDIAVGAAGLRALDDHAGRTDHHGNPLLVTAPAVADEVAGAAELAQGKLTGRPFALVRGLAHLLLDPPDAGASAPGRSGEPGDAGDPGASVLVRAEGGDLFGWGAREAVVRALRGDPADAAPFGAPATAAELAAAISLVTGLPAHAESPDLVRVPGALDDAATAPLLAPLALAHGWEPAPTRDETGSGGHADHPVDTPADAEARFRPRVP